MSTWQVLAVAMKRAMFRREEARAAVHAAGCALDEAKEALAVAELEAKDARAAVFDMAMSVDLGDT